MDDWAHDLAQETAKNRNSDDNMSYPPLGPEDVLPRTQAGNETKDGG